MVNSTLYVCPGCGASVIGHETCGDPTRPECAGGAAVTRSVEIPKEALIAATDALCAMDLLNRYSRAQWQEVADLVLQSALPYLAPAELCACGKPAEHADADPEDADWACRVPAGDGGLREALEKLAKDRDSTRGAVPSDYFIMPYELRELLAAHPAAPAVPQPVDREALAEVTPLDCGICHRDDSDPEKVVITYLAECGNHGRY